MNITIVVLIIVFCAFYIFTPKTEQFIIGSDFFALGGHGFNVNASRYTPRDINYEVKGLDFAGFDYIQRAYKAYSFIPNNSHGVFAERNIKKNEIIQIGRILCNHHENSNAYCGFDNQYIYIKAKRDIEKGEEIFINYQDDVLVL